MAVLLSWPHKPQALLRMMASPGHKGNPAPAGRLQQVLAEAPGPVASSAENRALWAVSARNARTGALCLPGLGW